MNQVAYDHIMKEIKDTVRVYRVYSVNKKASVYKVSTCRQSRDGIINELVIIFSGEPELTITENGATVFRRKPVSCIKNSEGIMRIPNRGILDNKTTDIYATLDECVIKSGVGRSYKIRRGEKLYNEPS